jgi:hypothetical protein
MRIIGDEGSKRGIGTVRRCSYVAVAACLISSTALADDSAATKAIKDASARLAFDQRPLSAVVRVSPGRDVAIARLALIAKSVLKGSSLKDGKVAVEPDCSGEVCVNRFAAPPAGDGRWEDGFDAASVVALRAKLAPGQSGKTDDGVVVTESEDGTLIERPGIFSLRVLGDGSAYRLVNHLNNYAKYSNAPIAFDVAGAEALGRRVIKELALAELSSREELFFLKARQTRFTGQVADPGDRPVSANIYFGRKFDGIPLVGAKGSTINIEVVGKGDVHSISVDWARLDVAPNDPPVRFASSDIVQRRLTAKSPTAKALACGYVDRGVGSPEKEQLELGCFVEDRASRERYIVSAEVDERTRVYRPLPVPPTVSNMPPTEEQKALAAPKTVELKKLPAVGQENTNQSQGAAGCSVGTTSTSSAFPLLLLAGASVAWGIARRRRRARGVCVAAVLGGVLSSTGAADAASFSTFMYRDFDSNWQNALSNTQWVNYNDWKDEFDDVASCVQCLQPTYLDAYMHGHATTYGSDLIAVSTHGTNSGWPNWDQYWGIFVGKAQNNYAYSWFFEAPAAQAGATEIMLLDACAIMPLDNAKMWGGYRNAYRRGNHIITGCWGDPYQPTCSMYDTGVNTTWNEIGDELADSNSTVWFSWKEGFSVGWADDDIVAYGSGIINNHDCDDVASGVSWPNRNNYADYQFAHDQGLWSTYEVCGYYQTNW